MTDRAGNGSDPPARMPRWLRIEHWAFAPTPATKKAGDWGRIWVRIFFIMYREFFRTHLAIRASALTFSIILSLIPILALSTSILKGLGSDQQLKLAAIRIIEQLEPPPPSGEEQSSVLDRAGGASVPAEAPLPAVPRNQSARTAYLHNGVDLIFRYVNQTNFAALGIVGVVGLIAVVILVLSTVEDAMNAIWHTHRGRSFFRKVMDYLALLILLPLSLNIALAAEAILASKKIMTQVSVIVPTAWVAAFFINFIPFVFIVITLMIMYLFFPQVKVKTGAALTGALFASIFWFLFQKIYIALQVGVASYNAIYGSFASIPLFLIWLQIGWTFILLGASLAHAIQHHRQYNPLTITLSPQRRLQLAFDILRIVYDRFGQRRPTPLSLLDEQFPTARSSDLKVMAALLMTGGLLVAGETANQEETLLPVTSADQLRASEVVQLILGNESLPSPGGQLATEAVEAAAKALDACLTVPQPPAG